MKLEIEKAADLIRNAGGAIALTGAGVSTESGIPDFRSRNGLWSRFDPMEYGTYEAFRRDPHKVWDMLAELLFVADAVPNEGHLAMARMEEAGLLQAIITQNIDGLHQKAGSTNVVEFHGSMASFSCPSCEARYSMTEVRRLHLPPHCFTCGAVLKPNIVFFDEVIPPYAIARTEQLVGSARVLIVAGTSCRVVPASSIPGLVKQQGGRVIEINTEPALAHLADITLGGGFAATMTALLEKLLE